MKKYYIMTLLFIAVFTVSIISPSLFTQSYRLTKVGYIDLERVIKEITNDQELNNKLKERLEQYKSQNNNTNMEDTSIIQNNNRDYSLRGEVKRQVAAGLIGIVKKEGYTLILERTEHAIL